LIAHVLVFSSFERKQLLFTECSTTQPVTLSPFCLSDCEEYSQNCPCSSVLEEDACDLFLDQLSNPNSNSFNYASCDAADGADGDGDDDEKPSYNEESLSVALLPSVIATACYLFFL
jgi:hypothetical protein